MGKDGKEKQAKPEGKMRKAPGGQKATRDLATFEVE